jgi:energy-coupling factor transporter ATP-binding protein EcfA2
MIRCSGIRYRYPESGWVLDGIDLTIDEGQYLAVFGASGSGKSSLGQLLAGFVPHFFGGTLTGQITENGCDITRLPPAKRFARIGIVVQNTDAQLFSSTVENELAFGLENLGLPAESIRQRIDETLQNLGLTGCAHRQARRLSGGQKRLAAIASVVCLKPKLLICDEPFASLDATAAARVRQVLCQLHRQGTTLVVIEQRIGDFLSDATGCVILSAGRIQWQGAPGLARPQLEAHGLIAHYPPRQHPTAREGDLLLETRGLHYHIEGRPILRGIDLAIRRAETVAITGANGSGKTTLIQHFNGLLKPTAGAVRVGGKPLANRPVHTLAADVAIGFQNPNDQFFCTRVISELEAGAKILGRFSKPWFDEICRIFHLASLLERSPYRLSEGEKKRVATASILAMGAAVFVLDEPTSGQDARCRQALAGCMRHLQQLGTSLVVATHDLDFARAVADRRIVLDHGQVVSDAAFQPPGHPGCPSVCRTRPGGIGLVRETLFPDGGSP